MGVVDEFGALNFKDFLEVSASVVRGRSREK